MSLLSQFDVTAAYIQGTKSRRKKRYILLLYSPKSEEINIKTLERAITTSHPEHILLRIEDPDEALKILLLKNVELVIIDYAFLDNTLDTIDFAAEIKQRKPCPIFFTTHEENKLIEAYREKLFMYEEHDDYLPTPLDFVQLTKILKKLTSEHTRSAKRFMVNVPVSIYNLDNNTQFTALLMDLSIVGAGIRIPKDVFVPRFTQLRMTIPLEKFSIFHPEYGDFLKLALRVQRVSIHGQVIGCSIEYLTQMQKDCLYNILDKIARRARIFRHKVAQQQSQPKALAK